MAFVVAATWAVKEGEQEAVAAAIEALRERSRNEPGNLLYQSSGEPTEAPGRQRHRCPARRPVACGPVAPAPVVGAATRAQGGAHGCPALELCGQNDGRQGSREDDCQRSSVPPRWAARAVPILAQTTVYSPVSCLAGIGPAPLFTLPTAPLFATGDKR